jgi:lipopolysaccharide cholinephosphotransferase
MTEIERIIEKGIITKDFLEPETRGDFYVDGKRKRIWAIQLDLLNEIDRVCKKHGLKYYFVGGSLLGAVRHKGYIPWDDDVDIALFRDDYEKLLSLKEEFSHPYFLQRPGDEGYYYSFIKFRNSNTSCVCDVFKYEKWNQGIFIDIFPIDEYVMSDIEPNYKRINQLGIDNSTCMRMSNKGLSVEDKIRVENYKGASAKENLEEINRIATKYANTGGDCYIIMLITLYDYKNKIIQKDEIKSIEYLDFENTKVPVMNGYKEFLTRLYKDYMKFPPVEERGSWHQFKIINADLPYTEYLCD